jgi:YHS domain-containing protein
MVTSKSSQGSYGALNDNSGPSTSLEGGFQEGRSAGADEIIISSRKPILYRVSVAVGVFLFLVCGPLLYTSTTSGWGGLQSTSLSGQTIEEVNLVVEWYADPDSVELIDDCTCEGYSEEDDVIINSGTDCRSTASPAAGGVDVVEIFNKASQGYDQSNYTAANISSDSSTSFTSVHRGYTYYFETQANAETFAVNPDKYIPQFGGFCAYGIGAEFCNNGGWIWDEDCQGPSAHTSIWMVKNDKLYFLASTYLIDNYFAVATYFDAITASAEVRWNAWYPDGECVFIHSVVLRSSYFSCL